MASKALPSQEVLRQLLDYDPETGALTWRERGVEWFKDGKQTREHSAATWNGKNAGRSAFTTPLRSGHLSARLLGRTSLAHRVIWKWMTGDDADTVDHIDGKQSNNRWDNLRSVAHAINGRNCKLKKNNTSGANGVSWCNRRKKWAASVHVDYRKRFLGEFEDFEKAVAVRRAAEKAHGFHKNHGRAS